jgi:low affinity Fe/Cu permease
LKRRNEEVKTEAEMLRVEEIDKKIDELIRKTGQYKADYFRVDR